MSWRDIIQAVAEGRREATAWARHFTGEGHATVSRHRRGMSAELAGVNAANVEPPLETGRIRRFVAGRAWRLT
jgi:hypothetical protein